MDFINQIRVYVPDVVFYGVDCDNLLPVVPDKNDRRYLYHDEQKSSEKVSILDKRNVGEIVRSKPIVAVSIAQRD